MDARRIKAVLDRVPREFSGKEAQAGWFPGAHYEDGTSVAYVAMIQENGAPERGIPARPFMKPTADAHGEQWVETLKDGVKAVASGKATADQVFEAMALQMAGDTQAQIASNAVAPLSPTTLVLRKWRREGRKITGATVGEAAAAYAADPSIIDGVPDDPLQDTGLMIATLTGQVGAPE